MIAGEAPRLETFFLSHRYGRPKDVDQAPDKPPIVFVSQYGPPGSYDPLGPPGGCANEGRGDLAPAVPALGSPGCSAPRGNGRWPRRGSPWHQR
jgi:hypothetical protein